MAMYWYKNAVIYSLDVKSYKDGNGDGMGDFTGLLDCLDYIKSLGINCIWLLPFYPSPLKDAGYDVSDYYNIHDRVGTLSQFVELTERAKELDIRIMTDLVVNHTSDQHPWFQEARRDKTSRYRDYYIWEEEKPEDDSPDVIFAEKQGTNWEYDEVAGEWFYHTFYAFQPDLNVTNPDVQEEIKNIVRFWIELGVVAFRLDAVPHLLREKGSRKFEGDPHQFLRDLRNFAEHRNREVVLLGEADTKPDSYKSYFGNSDQLHMLLNFYMNNYFFLALARKSAEPLTRSLRVLPHVNVHEQFANFVRNHDELDLEQLQDDEREEVFKTFAPNDDMRIYGRGIKRRLPPMLNNHPGRIKMTYSLLFSLPGTPVLRYGEEIGMGDLLELKERNSVRTVMQWANVKNGGFSTAEPDRLFWPAISDGEYGYQHVNVYDEVNDQNSLLNHISRLIYIRKSFPVFGWGQYNIIETDNPAVLAHLSRWRDCSVLILHNFSDEAGEVVLNLKNGKYYSEILADQTYDPPKSGSMKLKLGPYGFRWLLKRPLPPIKDVD